MPDPHLHYTVDCRMPEQHVFHVTLTFAGFGPGPHDLALPVWTPGVYALLDSPRHIFELRAEGRGGSLLPVSKIRKNIWRIDGDAEEVTVRYSVYAFDTWVAGAHLDDTHAYVSGAMLFFFVDGKVEVPVDLQIEAPAGWHVTTGLDQDGDDPLHFTAPDYDVLIDCPVEVGTQRTYTFTVDGKPHTVAFWGSGNQDDAEVVRDTQRIVEAQASMFGGLPYRHYAFIFHLGERREGGLEHLNSTTCTGSRFEFRPWKSYRRWLHLVSHEFFHLWNVKRIRPLMLGPFDYHEEVYTRLLWAMEGFTDYYSLLLLERGGVFKPSDYFEELAELVKQYESLPGRHVMDLSRSSFDTWIFLYTPDEDSPNRTISYYLKGGLVGLLLDMEIRRRTKNGRSLDDVLRLLYRRYGEGGLGFPEHVYRETVAEVAGGDMDEFFARYVDGVAELPLDEAFHEAGLEIRRSTKDPDADDGGEEPPEDDGSAQPHLAWLGVKTETRERRLFVQVSYTSGPCSGILDAGDEVIAVSGDRILTEEDLQKRLRDRSPGDAVTVTVSRRGRLLEREVVLAKAPADTYRIVRVAQPTPAQQGTYLSWLGTPWPSDRPESP